MEHSLHLGAGHIIEQATPGRTKTADQEDEPSSGGEDSDGGSCALADALRKVLGLVRQVCIFYYECIIYPSAFQVRKSPQARAFFKRTCREVEVPELELILFVRTRWASMFFFLDRVLKLQKVWLISCTCYAS